MRSRRRDRREVIFLQAMTGWRARLAHWGRGKHGKTALVVAVAAGILIYAAADNQTVGSLAEILIRAGAVRAMELDINSYWVSFIDYGQPGAHAPTNLLPDMTRSAFRYLEPDDRDFFAVLTR